MIWAVGRNFRSHLFAGDCILIEPESPYRLEQSASAWGDGSYMDRRHGSLNNEILRIEGLR